MASMAGEATAEEVAAAAYCVGLTFTSHVQGIEAPRVPDYRDSFRNMPEKSKLSR
jgi:hypothetical protein